MIFFIEFYSSGVRIIDNNPKGFVISIILYLWESKMFFFEIAESGFELFCLLIQSVIFGVEIWILGWVVSTGSVSTQ